MIKFVTGRKSNMDYSADFVDIAVLGGGNIGTQFACMCAAKGYHVNLFTSKPELFDNILETVDERENVTTGHIMQISSDLKKTVEGCKIIFVAYPAFFLASIAKRLSAHIRKDMVIFMLPGTGGAEFAFHECIIKGAILAGLQRVPSVARIEKPGKRVRCEGLRSELFLASIPSLKANELSAFISQLWGIKCTPLPNYLSVTLTPSNPILHTTRLRTLFKDYTSGMVYKRNPLFYGEWDDESSRLLIACDEELQNMLKMIKGFDLQSVRSLKLHYDSNDAEGMTKKLRSINSLHNLRSPMKQVEDGWIPDFESRYFKSDFPYGLAIIEEYARVLNYRPSNILATMNWYREVTGDTQRFDLRDYGIHSIADIYKFY